VSILFPPLLCLAVERAQGPNRCTDDVPQCRLYYLSRFLPHRKPLGRQRSEIPTGAFVRGDGVNLRVRLCGPWASGVNPRRPPPRPLPRPPTLLPLRPSPSLLPPSSPPRPPPSPLPPSPSLPPFPFFPQRTTGASSRMARRLTQGGQKGP
jgi:hypothetical protein